MLSLWIYVFVGLPLLALAISLVSGSKARRELKRKLWHEKFAEVCDAERELTDALRIDKEPNPRDHVRALKKLIDKKIEHAKMEYPR